MSESALLSFLKSSCSTLPSVGPFTAQRLARLEIHSIFDLLLHLPRAYQDRRRTLALRALPLDEPCAAHARVIKQEHAVKSRIKLRIHVHDGTGSIILGFIHGEAFHKHRLKPGTELWFYGTLKKMGAESMMIHPEYHTCAQEHISGYLALYPTTEALAQSKLRDVIEKALQRYQNILATLPTSASPLWRRRYEALSALHRPTQSENFEARQTEARAILCAEEWMAQHLKYAYLRDRRPVHRATALAFDPIKINHFIEALPYELTQSQRTAIQEILHDIKQPHAMMRLLQGDVGSGKTIVAACVLLAACLGGHQAALMVPTEILCEQHTERLREGFASFNIPVLRLDRSLSASDRRHVEEQMRSQRPLLVIGTHALFQESVNFCDLVLVVTDEQHRFGVQQRLALSQKGLHTEDPRWPHQLMMSATPIPRTLSMMGAFDLEFSSLRERPKDRLPVHTYLMPQGKKTALYERLATQCGPGKPQAYWICPLIEESEHVQLQTAQDALKQLQEALPSLRMDWVHGRMRSQEKEAQLSKFRDAEIDILVATTVVEVGVDVPNASIMIIEHAERLGLAQLHQLRGRVGRGTNASHCILLYASPLSRTARARLSLLKSCDDGFAIAEEDLKIRGPGNILGSAQSGVPTLRIASWDQEPELIAKSKQKARALTETEKKSLLNLWFPDFEAFRKA